LRFNEDSKGVRKYFGVFFFNSFPSASSRHLAIFSKKKIAPGVTPVLRGVIQKLARGGHQQIPNKAKIPLSSC